MSRLCDWLMTAAGIAFLGGLLTPWRWLIGAAAILCLLGLWKDPEETEEQRQYRHAQRKPDRADQLIAEHLKEAAGQIEPRADWDHHVSAAIGLADSATAQDFQQWDAEQHEWRAQL